MKIIKKLTILTFTFLIVSVWTIPNIRKSSVAQAATLSNVSYSKNTITNISSLSNLINSNIEQYFNSDVVYKLPDTINDDDCISVIVELDDEPLYDIYNKSNIDKDFSEYVSTSTAKKKVNSINKSINAKLNEIDKANIDYTLGEKFNTLLSGFEIEIKAKDFDKLNEIFSSDSLILGEVYNKAETEVVENAVNVYETGIFDSSNVDYQGDGVVVAVLDTGLDYTHTAFSVDNFTTTNEAFTLKYVSSKIKDTLASTFTEGLTGEDVYVSKKVPYAYDYADKDPDVAPINSEHGTHVAGIIAGKDDVITGVAPNAQLAIFKVFSDFQEGAKTSWILSALEDCVIIGVDLINMSLGSANGFSRERDEERINVIYDKIKDSGIEMIVAAGNEGTSTSGSEKNGSNGLTSNPDSATVGSPSTYDATLSVASIDGVKTSYLKHGNQIIYFNEAATNNADQQKSFVDDILKTLGTGETTHEFEYVVIPGIGRSSDYPDEDSFYQGKIVLVKRGTSTFEEKIRIALIEKGAAGIIVYNNISGTISMSVGADVGACCSLSQDDGEYLVSQVDKETGIGKIIISKDNLAGPFMSSFSSWGPTPDLKIKPEISGHGGQIYSAVPGQSYDRLSGTSMACPNLAGVAALVTQYVKYSGVFGNDLTRQEISNIVNQLMMSTADIIYDKNGLPSLIRNQGAGLVNIDSSINSEGYLTTYDTDGNKMDKAKLELGDDKNKTGVYTMTFDINNISNSSISYDISQIVLTEGVSTTYTSHSDTTVNKKSYELSGTSLTIDNVKNGTLSNKTITVDKKTSATVTVTITLTDENKKYLNDSFENGMYVEGFISLKASGTNKVDLNAPYLAFFGDWTEAPIFDEEYYDTNVDEINKGIDQEDKLMADAYATRVIGGLYTDYIATLGTYYFTQDPSSTQIAASKEHIAVSNQNNGEEANSTISSIREISAGLLRNVKETYLQIVDESTQEVVYSTTIYDTRKSRSYGSSMYGSTMEIKYDILEHNLKNNTRYICTLTAYIDYEENETQNNKRNIFSFPFYVDFEAPIITDCVFRTEYDKTSKETHFYADLSIYDNHYAQAISIGQIVKAEEGSEYTFNLQGYGKYMTPVYSSYNSTSIVSIELTDYIKEFKNSCGIKFNDDGSTDVLYNTNTFIATVYDYGMNGATYEISLPDEIEYLYFNEENVNLSPNETLDLTSVLNIYPSTSWIEILDFKSSNENAVKIVNNTLIAIESGISNITAVGKDINGNKISATLNVKVLSESDEGYVGGYSIPEINKFSLDGYKTIKAYYSVNNDDRDIGLTDGEYSFGSSQSLKMYPSETVKVLYTLDSFFPDKTSVEFKSSNSKIATVNSDGEIIAQAKGSTTIMVSVLFDGQSTFYSGRISIEVKDPFTIQSIYLNSYKGLGGTVEIPSNRGITTINSYAFSNYEYVNKDLTAGDVIDDEDPYYIKQMFLGEDTIKKVIIPEGVTTISSYAFANLTGLEEVVLPSTLIRIGVGAFYNCTSLTKINMENVKFINKQAFSNCPIEDINLNSAVTIGVYAFENCKLNYIILPNCTQSLSTGAFYNNEYLTSVSIKAKKVKIAPYVFAKCNRLTSIKINASVISQHAFEDCTDLSDVTLGQDVAVIQEYAFSNTKVSKFKIEQKNPYLTLDSSGALILKGTELILAAPGYVDEGNTITTDAESISSGAFSGNKKVFYLVLNNCKNIGDYAFANCTNLKTVIMPSVETIGNYAFYGTALTNIGVLSNLKSIGEYAFAKTDLETLSLVDDVIVNSYAFAYCEYLETVTVGNNVKLGDYSFYNQINLYTYEMTGNFDHYTPYNYEVKDKNGNTIKINSYYRYNFNDGVNSKLTTINIGNDCTVGEAAFFGNGKLTTVNLGNNTIVENYGFYSCHELVNIDFTNVKSIGDYAFSGYNALDYYKENNIWRYAYESEYTDGAIVSTAYMYTCFSPQFTSANLANISEVGISAFSGNDKLTNVTLCSDLTEVSKEMFSRCINLNSIALSDKITKIGDYSFAQTGLTTIDLSNIDSIGEYALFNTPVNNLVFKDNAEIGSYAFYYAQKLTNISNTQNIKIIGNYSFALTGIEKIDIQNISSIGDFAFLNSSLIEVIFGDKLVSLGENPFYGTNIETYGKTKDIIFNNNKVGTELIETYYVSSSVKVIDGVLYKVVPNGYVLVSYPKLKEGKEYTIDENTVRISALAFGGSNIEKVVLSNVLISIGDKAFYDCQKLSAVVFRSYNAPRLEEEYNINYLLESNIPTTGQFGTVTGLGISKYYIWNVFTNYTNFYFGANFKDYIGHDTGELIMVKPQNGLNYDSFIFNQYFSSSFNGAFAPTDNTLYVIELINNLKANITLDDENEVKKVREEYNQITSEEQKALITNYDQLVKAESTLNYLKSLEQKEEPVAPVEPVEPSQFKTFVTNNMYGLIIALVIAVSYTVVLILVIKKKKVI